MKAGDHIAIILLAAGASSRMGTIKQLLPWEDTTLLGHAITSAKNSEASDIYVVLGANPELIKKRHPDTDVHWLLNKKWEQGMGTSIACAMAHILNTSDSYDGVLIMLCDQPLIDAVYLNKLLRIFKTSKAGIVATAYEHRNGVPILLAKRYFPKLKKLDSDYGAKKVIAKNVDDVITVLPRGKERDLDTLDDYNQLFKESNK